MEIHSLQDFENALSETREEFRKTTAPIRHYLDSVAGLFLEGQTLISTVARDTDDERYALEVIAAAFRRVMASVVLLESGLPQEAHMILRNAIELMLIAVDIAHSTDSLIEWKKTVTDNLKDYDEWYFRKSKICRRIDKNERDVYPELERKLALHCCGQWELISNMSVHAHSQAQIRQLFDCKGNFQLLGRKETDAYQKDFIVYQEMIFDLVTLLIGIPKYRNSIGQVDALAVRRNQFAENYSTLRDQMNPQRRVMENQL